MATILIPNADTARPTDEVGVSYEYQVFQARPLVFLIGPRRFCSNQAGGGGGGGAGNESVLASEAKNIQDQLTARGGQFDVEAITMQYPVLYEESMNTVSPIPLDMQTFTRRPMSRVGSTDHTTITEAMNAGHGES